MRWVLDGILKTSFFNFSSNILKRKEKLSLKRYVLNLNVVNWTDAR